MDMKTNEAALTRFTSFITERHRIWLHRMRGEEQPWTTDPILQSASFCNVFRVLDRGSQQIVHFLWTDEGLSLSPLRTLILCWLYRRTNKTDGWSEAVSRLGLPMLDVSGENTGALIASVHEWLSEAQHEGIMLASSQPYNVANGCPAGKTIVEALDDDTEMALISGSLQNAANILPDCHPYEHEMALTTLGATRRVSLFLAQQILTDFGYSQYGSAWYENQVVVSGPGSRRGLARITGDESFIRSASEAYCSDIIEWLREYVIENTGVRLDLEYAERRPSLMDVQNCLCEFDKYSRYSEDPDRGYRRFSHHTTGRLTPVYPKIWN